MPAVMPLERFNAFRRAVDEARAIFISDAQRVGALPPEVSRGLGIGAFVVIPLLSEGRCLGFLTCDQRGEPFTLEPSEVDLLTTFGALIAAFLEKAIEHGELRRLNELKSQFAALASHELRTPAAAIYGVVQTLDQLEDELTPHQRRDLRTMLTQQAKRLLELVENLLDLSRLEADSIRIAPTPIDVVQRLQTMVENVFGSNGDVTLDAPADLAAVVDANAFDRIVSNLLVNARRHGAPPIRVGATRDDGELWVTIEDRGPGVAQEFVGSLFERFTRGPTESSEGAGLGLSIAQSFARAHGGSLTYEPASPHGACFRLVLPSGVRGP